MSCCIACSGGITNDRQGVTNAECSCMLRGVMAWTIPQFDNARRNRAGRALVKGAESDEDLEVINNWRSSHSAPLQTIKMLLLKRARAVDHTAVVAQRLKRLTSIRAKLQREPTMRLTQMQDIGGCRAIVRDISALEDLMRRFSEGAAKNPTSRHETRTIKDYVDQPKSDGYRSVHHVFRYRTESPALKPFEGHLIEVQMRTRLQHAWATAVEVVDTFTGQSLKTSLKLKIGDANWKRFFALMGTALAVREDTAPVPDTPTNTGELRRELADVAARINAEGVLSGLGTAVRLTSDMPKYARSFLLVLDATARHVEVTAFNTAGLELAQQEYLRLEKQYETRPTTQIVQVSVENVDALRTAFPNYYLDTTAFIEAVRVATSRNPAPEPRVRQGALAI